MIDAVEDATEARESPRRLLAAQRLSEAIEAAQRSVSIDAEDATSWLILGAAQLEASRHAEATATFRSCVNVAKRGPVAECRAFTR